MAHSAGTQGPTRSKGSRQLTSTCGIPSLAHGHWPGADGRFGGGEADAGDSRNGGVDDLERLRPPLAVRMRFQDNVPSKKPSQGCRSAGGSCRCERPGWGRLRPHRTEVEPRHMARIGGCIGRLCSAVWTWPQGDLQACQLP